MYQTEEERIAKRAMKVAGWLEWMEAVYANLISRPSETASVSGFDDKPRTKPCEHRRAWMRGRLCLACENTGWRPLTIQERSENLGIDPYATDLQRDRVVVVESTSRKRAREAAHIDHVIEQLKHLELVRAGEAVLESTDARTFRQVSHKAHPLEKILTAIEYLRVRSQATYEALDRDTLCKILAHLVKGPIDNAPEVAS